MSDQALLSIRDLTITFPTAAGPRAVVDRLNLDISAGEVLGIVGESGSGKSLTALSILRLIARPGRVTSGTIYFADENILEKSEAQMHRLRGAAISMIFQEPMSSLNPVFTIGDQIAEPLRQHRSLSRKAARKGALDLLQMVEIPDGARRLDEYPHQLSGGMRQRVMIAIALACRPKLLIADEPTTALDVTIQAQILDLLRNLQRDLQMAVMLITHDLGVVAEFADRAVVMYAGRAVESAPVRALFNNPAHPYTRGLLASIPPITGPRTRLNAIAGAVPQPAAMQPGCRFAPRCMHAIPACPQAVPAPVMLANDHQVHCLLHAAPTAGAA
ncbi:MAG: ABC transporter ATP-binding protein [Beijerinckiaceae bacterium]